MSAIGQPHVKAGADIWTAQTSGTQTARASGARPNTLTLQ
jgi:hypothetical protein